MDAPEITHLETRYVESDGSRMRDIHKIDELPAVVEKIERDNGRLVGVRPFE